LTDATSVSDGGTPVPAAPPASPAPAAPSTPAGVAPTSSPPPASAPPTSPSILGTPPADGAAVDPPAAHPATWPADWRDQFAAGDPKVKAKLDRYTTPADLAKAYRSMEAKLSSGELKSTVPFPEKGTHAEQQAWRQAQGVPDRPEDYKIELKNGMVVGEADKPIVDEFTKRAHELNWTPKQVSDVLQFYYDRQDAQTQQLNELDAQRKLSAEDTLRAELGNEYRATVNMVNNYLSADPDFAERLLGGRLADGTRIADDPAFIKWMANQVREINPLAALVPAGADQVRTVSDRKASLEAMMGDRNSEYWKGPKAEAMQAEYRAILEAQDRARGRAA
jgi:hypothetical protein